MSKLDILNMLYERVIPLEGGLCVLEADRRACLYDWERNQPVTESRFHRIRPVEGTPFVILEELTGQGRLNSTIFHTDARKNAGVTCGKLLVGDKLPALTSFRRANAGDEDTWFVCANGDGRAVATFTGVSLGKADTVGCALYFTGRVKDSPRQLWYLTDDFQLKTAAEIRGV